MCGDIVVTICKNLELEYGIFGTLSSTEAKPFEVRQRDFNKTSESEEGIESKEKGGRVVETNSAMERVPIAPRGS